MVLVRCDAIVLIIFLLRYWWEVDWGGFGLGFVWPWRRHLQSGRPGQRLLGRKAGTWGNARVGRWTTGWRFVAIQHFFWRYMPASYFACSPHLQRVKRLPISEYEIITVYICMPLGCICTEMFAVFWLKALWLVARKAWSTSHLHVKCLEAFLRWHPDATVSVTRDDHQCRIRHFSSLALQAAVGIRWD